MTHKFHPSIIRAYDIRGVYNETLFDDDAYFLAKSFASFLRQNNKSKIVIGNDGRKSSPALKKRLIEGLKEFNLEILDVELGPTPFTYFSLFEFGADAAIMVTGSHNPKNHNGFKIALKERPFFGEDIIDLANLSEKGDFFVEKGEVKSSYKSIAGAAKEKYLQKLTRECLASQNNDLKIA